MKTEVAGFTDFLKFLLDYTLSNLGRFQAVHTPPPGTQKHSLTRKCNVRSFAKLRKATISFFTPVSLPVCPRGKTRISLDGLSCNLSMSRKFKFHYNLTRITGAVHKDVFTFMTFRLIFLRMRYVSDESCTESQNTYFTFNYFFRKSCRL